MHLQASNRGLTIGAYLLSRPVKVGEDASIYAQELFETFRASRRCETALPGLPT
jgi:hypothetical protein